MRRLLRRVVAYRVSYGWLCFILVATVLAGGVFIPW